MGWHLIVKGAECRRAPSLGEVKERAQEASDWGSIYMKFQNRQLCRGRKQIRDGLGRGVPANGHVAALWMIKTF